METEIVSIGHSLCRLTIRSKGERDLFARIPGFRVEDEDAEYIGWRVIFSEELRRCVEASLRMRRRLKDRDEVWEPLTLFPEDWGR